MLSYAEIKSGSVVVLDDEPFVVMSTSGVVKKQRQKPHNTAKLRNLKNGNVVERTFTQADKIEPAALEKREMQFVYANRGEAIFADPNNPGNRTTLPEEMLAEQLPYIRSKDIVDTLVFDEEVIGIEIPIKVDLRVTEAPPNIKGNTSGGGNKVVVVETGLKVTTPLFINTGDVIRINTQTGEYAERVS